MKTYVCWVCMKDFGHSSSLMKHETTKHHLELVFKQAMNLDIDEAGQRRSERRNFLSGVDDIPDGRSLSPGAFLFIYLFAI